MSNLKVQPPGISSRELLGLLNSVQNRCLSNPIWAIGSASKTTIKCTEVFDLCVKGVFFRKADDTAVAFTATTDDIAADANVVREAVYLIIADEAGTMSLRKGAEASGAGNAIFPDTPEGYACLGAVRIAVAAGATGFDATTDDLDEAQITDTYYNLSCNAVDWLAATA